MAAAAIRLLHQRLLTHRLPKYQTTEAASAEASPEASSTADSSAAQASEPEAGSADSSMVVRVGSLKGPTSMGLVQLMDAAANGEAALSYEFTMAGKAR